MFSLNTFPRKCVFCQRVITSRALCFKDGHNVGDCLLRLLQQQLPQQHAQQQQQQELLADDLGGGGWDPDDEPASAAPQPVAIDAAAANAFLLASDAAALASPSSDESDAEPDLEEGVSSSIMIRSVSVTALARARLLS
jgi:hypothetical protein